MDQLPPEVLQDWGDRVATRRGADRTRRNRPIISQTALAHLAGIDQSTVSRLENGELGNVSDDLKWSIAAALQCTVAELFPYPAVKPPFPEARSERLKSRKNSARAASEAA
jgi:transcriptional regulator with XRE-family HTH domain